MPPFAPFSFLALLDASPRFHAYLSDTFADLERQLDVIEHTNARGNDALLEAVIDELLLLLEQMQLWYEQAREAAMEAAQAGLPADQAAAFQAACHHAGLKRYFAPTLTQVDAEAGWLLVPAGDRDALEAWLADRPE